MKARSAGPISVTGMGLPRRCHAPRTRLVTTIRRSGQRQANSPTLFSIPSTTGRSSSTRRTDPSRDTMPMHAASNDDPPSFVSQANSPPTAAETVLQYASAEVWTLPPGTKITVAPATGSVASHERTSDVFPANLVPYTTARRVESANRENSRGRCEMSSSSLCEVSTPVSDIDGGTRYTTGRAADEVSQPKVPPKLILIGLRGRHVSSAPTRLSIGTTLVRQAHP